jgi:CBS-domain-containing membrane protein
MNFDSYFRLDNFKRHGLQCGLAGLGVLLLLLVLDAVTQTVLIASLGASAFIAFAVPRSLHSDPRHLVGGYVTGVAMSSFYALFSLQGTWDHAIMIVFGALAISVAMFAMVVTRTEHPPAAALALGLVLNEWDLLTLVVVLVGVIGLSIIKQIVTPVLMDIS